MTWVGIFGLVFLLIGLACLRFGLWPARLGSDPHCAECNYNLTGLTSNRCPECGTFLAPDAVRRGRRHRRTPLAVVGALSIITGVSVLGTFGYAASANVKWQQYYPTWWLLRELRPGSPETNRKAWFELNRRRIAGGLSASQQSQLADLCLEYPKPGADWMVLQGMTRFLLDGYRRGLLSPAQQATFHRRMAHIELQARPWIAQGGTLPFEYTVRQFLMGPENLGKDLWFRLSEIVVLVDDKPVEVSGLSGLTQAFPGGPRSRWHKRLSCGELAVGSHVLAVQATHAVFYGTPPQENKSVLCLEEVVRREAKFEIRPDDGSGGVTYVSDPALRDTLSRSISVACWQPRWHRPKDEFAPQFTITTTPLPMDVAFRVLFRVRGKEFEADPVCIHRGRSYSGPHRSPGCQHPVPKSVDVILRSSKEVALDTFDIFEIWQGELVFNSVPVKVD